MVSSLIVIGRVAKAVQNVQLTLKSSFKLKLQVSPDFLEIVLTHAFFRQIRQRKRIEKGSFSKVWRSVTRKIRSIEANNRMMKKE